MRGSLIVRMGIGVAPERGDMRVPDTPDRCLPAADLKDVTLLPDSTPIACPRRKPDEHQMDCHVRLRTPCGSGCILASGAGVPFTDCGRYARRQQRVNRRSGRQFRLGRDPPCSARTGRSACIGMRGRRCIQLRRVGVRRARSLRGRLSSGQSARSPRPLRGPCGPAPAARAPVEARFGTAGFASDAGSGSSFRVRRQRALAEMRLSVGWLRRWVIRQADVGGCGRLLVRLGLDVKVATAA